MTANPNNFLDLEPPDCLYDRSDFAVLPIPYDAATSYQSGTRNGPASIIAASVHLEDFDEEVQFDGTRAGIATMAPFTANPTRPEEMHRDLFEIAKQIVSDDKFLFGLGGDHSISSALVRAVMTRHEKISVLQIDAHCDLRDSYGDTKYSHACVMRRMIDLGASIVPVGIRSVCEEEHQYMTDKTIVPITAREVHEGGDWMDRVLQSLGETVYVTLDIDGIDPAYAPGTGTPEPGGLDYYQVTGLLRRVAECKNIVAADIVEVMPIPSQVVTEFLAAKLAYKLMTYVQLKK